MREKTKILFCLHPTGHDCANNGYRYMIILLQMLSHFLQQTSMPVTAMSTDSRWIKEYIFLHRP